jgi:polyisoprenyl-phosphate glycosyltransferase
MDLMPRESEQGESLSVVIPVYRNSDTLVRLCQQLGDLQVAKGDFEVVFVVDGSPDDSLEVLRSTTPTLPYETKVIELSRNFGAFAAIRTGLEHARGDYVAVIAADLQEPPELIDRFADVLRGHEADVVLGRREGRADPFLTRVTSSIFWALYRRLVLPQMPKGGVDVFACSRQVRDALLSMRERNTSLVGQLLWVGFSTTTVGYSRLERPSGRSSWTLAKRLRYMSDSVFSFTDLPVRLLLTVGLVGSMFVAGGAIAVLSAWMFGDITVEGYTPLMLALLFVGFILILGLGIVGSYVWRAYENTKDRPLTITRSTTIGQGPTPSE